MTGEDAAARPGGRSTGDQMRAFFDDLWADGDPWALESSALDQHRYDRQIALLGDRRYGRALEIGCAAGAFTRRLVARCDHVVAIDIAAAAVARAAAGQPAATYAVANVMESDHADDGPWDLVVMAETAYYLGWKYPLYDVSWLTHRLFESTADGGRLLLSNTFGDDATSIMSPALIRTYRDLFVHSGFEIEAEETISGEKETVRFEILLSLLRRPRP